jgi:ABC-2 type transport system permease protein
VLLAGGVALAPIGFALGFLARPRAASTIGNLVFLPLSFASGFFFPLSQLPAFLRDLAPYLPTYHYGRLIWSSFAPAADITAYTGIEPVGTLASVAWLVGTFVGLLAAVGVGVPARPAARRGLTPPARATPLPHRCPWAALAAGLRQRIACSPARRRRAVPPCAEAD